MGKKRKEKKIINMMCLCLLTHLVADINFFFLYKNEKKNYFVYINKKLLFMQQYGEHLSPATRFLLILIKYVCFVVNAVSILIYVCLLL